MASFFYKIMLGANAKPTYSEDAPTEGKDHLYSSCTHQNMLPLAERPSFPVYFPQNSPRYSINRDHLHCA